MPATTVTQDGSRTADASGRLAGKRAVVTGAGSGIGRASALAFARQGARVLLVDRNEEALAESVEAARALGAEALGQTADVGSEADVEHCVRRAVEKFGGLEVMFANAGISGPSLPLLEQRAEDWEAVLRINLIGVFLCVKYAAQHMVEHGGGSIVCTASVAALRAQAGPNPYSASKAGVVSLVQTAANSLAGTGVRVNALCPGLIETGMTQPIFDWARDTGRGDRLGQYTASRRAGTPDDIASAALFLASDDAAYVNGQALVVDGGLSSTHPFNPRKA